MKLHLGCGKRDFGPEWIHIDGAHFDHIQQHDIVNLEFPDRSVDLIYACHVLEYFDRAEVVPVLKEWFRVLRPGGILRLAVPDFGAMTKLYFTGYAKLEQILGPMYGKMGMDHHTIYHRTTYDFESLSQLLTGIGFYDVQRYNWKETEHAKFDDHSQAYLPHMDKENGTLISLNLECKRSQ